MRICPDILFFKTTHGHGHKRLKRLLMAISLRYENMGYYQSRSDLTAVLIMCCNDEVMIVLRINEVTSIGIILYDV